MNLCVYHSVSTTHYSSAGVRRCTVAQQGYNYISLFHGFVFNSLSRHLVEIMVAMFVRVRLLPVSLSDVTAM